VPSERLRLEMYKRLAEVREDADVDLLREEMRDRYGEPPAPAERLLAVARFRGRCRRAGVSEVGVQGKYVRFAPVELPESRVVRLNRLHPKSLVKAGMRTMLVPRPQPATFGAPPLRDDELLAWAGRVIDDIIDPPEKQEQKQESAS
jgi:transcription-repair coupling factor (superfamily II helicase)